MRKLIWTCGALATGALAWIVAINWQAFSGSTALDLGFASLQAPLGLLMAASAVAAAVVLAVASIARRLSSRREMRRLQDEIHRLHAQAEQAEGSRMENLLRLMAREFRFLADRLNDIDAKLASKDRNRAAEPPELPLAKLGPEGHPLNA